MIYDSLTKAPLEKAFNSLSMYSLFFVFKQCNASFGRIAHTRNFEDASISLFIYIEEFVLLVYLFICFDYFVFSIGIFYFTIHLLRIIEIKIFELYISQNLLYLSGNLSCSKRISNCLDCCPVVRSPSSLNGG